jgi:hypothetical protein
VPAKARASGGAARAPPLKELYSLPLAGDHIE